ncbi:MAG: tetratricopeptide repeat protein [Desulfobacterales bacterium]|nr:MAG: tetratricopeptide repeat protein [Desulfobacterales bacterium]
MRNLYLYLGLDQHKELRLTKVMAVWSGLTVLSFILPTVIAATGAADFLRLAANLSDDTRTETATRDRVKIVKKSKDKLKSSANVVAGKTRSTAAAVPPAVKNTDWVQKALALWQDGRYTDPQKAVEYWNQAIRNDPNSAVHYNNRGLAYYNLNQHRRALEDYSQALRLEPEYAEAYNNRGNVHYQLDEYQLALLDFDRSLQAAPEYAVARLNRGLTYFQLDENNQACRDFQQACDFGDCTGLQWAVKEGLCE